VRVEQTLGARQEMAASFGDPLTLSKHEISSKKTYNLAPVLASCSNGSKTEYATIGVHGEGINIIDVETRHLEPEYRSHTSFS